MTPFEEEEARKAREAEERAIRQAAMRAISETTGQHPECFEITYIESIDLSKGFTDKIDESRLAAIPAACEDEEILQAMEEWEEDVELWHGCPFMAFPSPTKEWLAMLDVVADAPEGIKFPPELAERIKEWIPAEMWDYVVQGMDIGDLY